MGILYHNPHPLTSILPDTGRCLDLFKIQKCHPFDDPCSPFTAKEKTTKITYNFLQDKLGTCYFIFLLQDHIIG
jgi:hypothetical protein